MFKKYKSVLQDGLMDCGVCSLLTIIRTHGGNVPKEYLRELTNTTKEGTNAFYLLEAGKKLGFDTKALKGDIMDLEDNYLPCIAHVIIDNKYQHFVVIQNINRKKKIITISDPYSGIKKYKLEDYQKITTNQYLVFIPNKPTPYLEKNKILFVSILQFLKKYKNIFTTLIIISSLYTILNILTSFTFQFMIEEVLNYNSKNNLYVITGFLLIVYLMKSTIDFCRNNLLNFINHSLDKNLIMDIFKHIMSLPYLYYKTRTTGEVVSRINDLGDIKDTISNLFATVFIDLILVTFVFITICKINLLLGELSLVLIISYIIIIKIFNKKIYPYMKKNQEEVSMVNSYMVESINNIDTIKSLSLIDKSSDKLYDKYTRCLDTSYNFHKLFNLESFFKVLINDIGLLLITFVAVTLVLNGKLSLGEILTYNAIIIYFLEPIKNILQMDLIIKKAKISFDRVTELYEIKKEELEIDEKYTGKPLLGNIKITNLDYSYYGRRNVLSNVNLEIKAKDKVMIYGKSGSGKSTIGKILMKFLKIERGKVFIDDKDINDYNTLDIRREICYIGQNENLFTDTIYNNIVMNRDVDYDTFLEVAKITKVDEIINSRNASYEMLLEENGFNISGGERQRLILARALINKSSIYILDESLNQVDILKEKEILNNLFSKYNDKTFIYISHRFNNISAFDQKIAIGENSCA